MAAFNLPDFGSCFYKFFDMGRDYPRGGTEQEYQTLVRLDIALHDAREVYDRIAHHMQQYSSLDSRTRTEYRDRCWTAARDAWNASEHLTPEGRTYNLQSHKALSELRTPSRLPAVRKAIIDKIRARVTAKPRPRSRSPSVCRLISTIPRWYKPVHPAWAEPVVFPPQPQARLTIVGGVDPADITPTEVANFVSLTESQLKEFGDEMKARWEAGEVDR